MQIAVIGLGVSAEPQLSPAACQALADATLVIGSARQLAVVAPLLDQQRQAELPPLRELKTLIDSCTGLVCLLASGDPLWYGIGRWLGQQFAPAQLRFHPAVSSIQTACHQLGLSVQDAEVLSLHGRPLAKLRTKLQANRTLIMLTDQQSHPQQIAHEALAAGFEQARLTVCEALGYPQQQVRTFEVAELVSGQGQTLAFDPLHVSVLETGRPAPDKRWLPEFPGIADQHFLTDRGAGRGMITKREVRLQILSLLQPAAGEVIWDIGAGCGSVAVELAYWAQQTQIYAIEHHPDRLECLELNRERFGVVSNLQVIEGRAEQADTGLLASLPDPQRIFIGGSDGELPALLHSCWQRLPVGGVMVASAVMERSRTQLLNFADQLSGGVCETLQVAISRGESLAGQLCYKPALPVTLFNFIKTDEVSDDR